MGTISVPVAISLLLAMIYIPAQASRDQDGYYSCSCGELFTLSHDLHTCTGGHESEVKAI